MDGSKSFCADDDAELSPDEIEMLSLLPDENVVLTLGHRVVPESAQFHHNRM